MSFEERILTLPETGAAIQTLTDEMCWPGDVFSKDEKIKKIFKFDALATHPNYRGKGIATKLIQQALIIAKKSHCDQGNSLKGIGNKTVIRKLQPEFKFPAKIEMAFSRMLAIRS
jgi:GNAT superfamily N-acetyltransferase